MNKVELNGIVYYVDCEDFKTTIESSLGYGLVEYIDYLKEDAKETQEELKYKLDEIDRENSNNIDLIIEMELFLDNIHKNIKNNQVLDVENISKTILKITKKINKQFNR